MAQFDGRENNDGILSWSFVDVFCCMAGALILIVVLQVFIIQDMIEWEEHQAVVEQLAEAEDELSQKRRELSELLQKHQETLEKLETITVELADTRQKLAREIEAHEATESELQKEIMAHQQTQQRLQAEKDAHQQTRRELATHKEKLKIAEEVKGEMQEQLDFIASLRDLAVALGADGPGNVIDVTGSDIYNLGDVVEIKALPEDGYEFTGWVGATDMIVSGEPSDPEVKITMDGRLASLTAKFREKLHDLELISNPEHYGKVRDVTGMERYEGGDQTVIEASPYIGFEFVKWEGDIEFIEDPLAASTVVNMPDKDIALTAVFKIKARRQ